MKRTNTPKIDIRMSSDFYGVYLDDKLVYQENDLDCLDVLKALKIKHSYKEFEPDNEGEFYNYPENLKELKVK